MNSFQDGGCGSCDYCLGKAATVQQATPEYQEGRRAVWEMVIDDMRHRDFFGAQKYGTRLQPFNGRDSIVDAYQEGLDLVVYLKQQQVERALAIELLEDACKVEHGWVETTNRIQRAIAILKGTK